MVPELKYSGFNYFWYFLPGKLGKIIQFDLLFSNGCLKNITYRKAASSGCCGMGWYLKNLVCKILGPNRGGIVATHVMNHGQMSEISIGSNKMGPYKL